MNVKSTELNGKSLVSWKSVFGTRRLPGHRPEQSLQAAHVDGNVRKECHLLLPALKHLSFCQNLLSVALFGFHGILYKMY